MEPGAIERGAAQVKAREVEFGEIGFGELQPLARGRDQALGEGRKLGCRGGAVGPERPGLEA